MMISNPGDENFATYEYSHYNPHGNEYNGYTSFEDGIMALVTTHEKFLTQTEQQIEELKERRQALQDEIQKHLPPPDVVSKVLTLNSIYGLSLTNFSQEKHHNIIKFGADGCVVKNQNLFHVDVFLRENEVVNLHLQLTENSPLWEIYPILVFLLTRKCPSLLLRTIQRFMHMSRLRKNIALKLITCPKKNFRVFLPTNCENKATQDCKVIASRNGQTVLEVMWKFKWSREHHSLIHSFHIEKDIDGQFEQELLKRGPFCYRNEKNLEKIWLIYQNHLSRF
ncbi:putative FAD-linked oxidoreductase YitY [Frankliniella fusca]|uniref:FAD-linked oxidoreductase YitY n=1 Tax=Frankliniella fusca TaxID=407009 RepID=A0AAE1HBN8_9NEOP|nr:putative FAD-linked oxidoreductase YitY [Frankliniella fusca]